jgi:hypothetical protein
MIPLQPSETTMNNKPKIKKEQIEDFGNGIFIVWKI